MDTTTSQPALEHPSSALSDRTIIRAQRDRDNPYFLMRRDAAQDGHLSWEARGVLAYVLSKADNWKVRLSDLRRQGGVGRDVTRRILKELESTGYLTRERVRLAHGRFDWMCTVHEKPQTAKNTNKPPCPEKRSTVERSTVERSTVERSTVEQPIYKQEKREIRDQEITEPTNERENTTHQDAASPRVRVGALSPDKKRSSNISRYTKQQIRLYVDSLDDVRNPGGLTQSLWLSGDADSDIADYLEYWGGGWMETAPQEAVRVLCDYFEWDESKVDGYVDHIKANVVTEFELWLEAIKKAQAKAVVKDGVRMIDLFEAVAFYCEMVREQRERAAAA